MNTDFYDWKHTTAAIRIPAKKSEEEQAMEILAGEAPEDSFSTTWSNLLEEKQAAISQSILASTVLFNHGLLNHWKARQKDDV